MAVAACAALSSGCGPEGESQAASSAASGPAKHGGRVVVAVAKEPPILNFWLAPGAMAIAQQLTDGLSDPLIVLDEKGRWQPVMATEVPTIKNGGVQLDGGQMRVTVHIKRRAHWSDNTPVSCEDVRFSWQVATNPSYQIATRLGWDQITAVDCPDPRTAVIRFGRPYALYLSRILAVPPLPAHALRGKDFNTFWNERITVSSGPYLFHDWQRGVRLVLKRNPNYWRAGADKRPYLDEVVFRFVKDANTLKMQLRMKEADMAFIPADTNLTTELKSTPDVRFAVLPGAVMELLVLRTTNRPLTDKRVRQAIAHLIDRRMITKVILSGMVDPASDFTVTDQAPAYAATPLARYAKPDRKRAASLLREAGYVRKGTGPWLRNGKPITLTWVAGAGSMPFRAKVAQLVQEQLRREGIGTEIRLIPSEVLYSHIAPHGQFDLGEWSELTGAEPMPSLIYGCSEIPRKPSWAGKNRSGWCSKPADALMRAADGEPDPTRRAVLVKAAGEVLADEVPFLPLFQSPDVVAWRDRLQGLRPNPTSNHTWTMDEWWVTDA